ncbi:hypothetical protein COCMIDRAFT_41700 [Bipolaris oryzae ATCC 44560]|uniref:Major facilitator superfamily (MFS) profile domain-containing protein n=1 Tax=Bipolaris oryzae ATCC 44560 TaxID=930090 RepID=W6Z847_COCMI|nr:uncharacterized protein COCMIDRAFT_41700 [Bipolaris oryzae ATCC 44560]EUC39871.1 hypothetical protein COCMIDRAFT_41700 [Bipolaris oryzae ATCC 44560]
MVAYLCLCLCYFTSYFDMNAVTTTLPTIALLGQTAFQPLYGRLSDVTGRKPILLVSVTCTMAGGLLCGFARSSSWLYTAHVLSGIGGGGISSLVAIIVSDLLSLKERGKYRGMINLAIGVAATGGPSVAASLVRYPILAAFCLVLLLLFLPLKPVTSGWQDKAKKIDWLGIAASFLGIIIFLIPINSGGSIWPWRSAYTIPMIIIDVFCLIVFALYEGYWARLPIMPWQLFQRWFPSATLILPFLLAQRLAGASSGSIMSKLARTILRVRFLLWSLRADLKLVFSRTTPLPAYLVILAIEGAGVDSVHQPGLVALQTLSRPEDRAVATSTRNLLRFLGGVASIAISIAVQYRLTRTVIDGGWQAGASATVGHDTAILSARTKGFQAVFALLVSFIKLRLFDSLLC